MLYLSEHIALLSPPICRSLVMTVWLSLAQSQFSSNFVSQRSANSWSQGDVFMKTCLWVTELLRTPFVFVDQSLAIIGKHFTSSVGWTSLNSIKGHKYLKILLLRHFCRVQWGRSKLSSLYCTKIYPMAFMFLPPLSDKSPLAALFPHVLESSGCPAVPNPILESQLPQTCSLFPRIPILALAKELYLVAALNPSLLQLACREAWEPISFFHVLRPSDVARYFPSAINECREAAFLLITMNLICWPIFIPRQIVEKDVFQYDGSLVSWSSNPVLPPGRL